MRSYGFRSEEAENEEVKFPWELHQYADQVDSWAKIRLKLA